MENEKIEIRQNGFLFVFQVEEEIDGLCRPLLDDLGEWSDEPKENAIKNPDAKHDSNWFAYFNPANLPTVKELMELPEFPTEASAKKEIKRQARYNYNKAKSWGYSWDFKNINCKAFLDQPEAHDIVLASHDISCVDDVDAKRLKKMCEAEVSDLMARAFQRVAELAALWANLVITRNK